MSKPAPRTLETIRSHYLTPHMLRVTLGGAELAGFPEDQESAYIKLIFPQPEAARPLMRTYTISAQRGEQERQVPKSHLYISSYWKINSTEDQHKIEKRDDAQAA